MGPHRRWSKETKLAILEEAERNGIAQTCRKHGIAASQIHDWKKKLQLLGEAGLTGYVPKEDPETHRLRVENQALKEMIAEQALALRIKDSLLKNGIGCEASLIALRNRSGIYVRGNRRVRPSVY